MRLKKRVEKLERKVKDLECYSDKLYDEDEYLLYNLNMILGRNPAIADPLPYVSSVEALVELLKQQKRINETPQQNYQDIIKSLEERVEKQEEAINELTQMCQTLLLANFNDCMKDLENELKDLFSSEPAKKCKKGAKSSAEKCKKCGESAKTTKKTSKKESK